MPQVLPDLSLTLGQMMWAINEGRDPDKLMRDQVRYLRLIGIPPAAGEGGRGSGNRIRYGFFDLVELGIAAQALRFRFRPKDIAAVLVDNRDEFRSRVEETWFELPDAALDASWVKSRGKERTLLGNVGVVRLHDRRSEKWGTLDFAWLDDAHLGVDLFQPIERFEDGEVRVLLPLNTLMLTWVAWALEAPAVRTGPR